MKNNSFLVWMLGFPVSAGLFLKLSGIGAPIPVLIIMLLLWVGLGYSLHEGCAAQAKPAARTKKAKKR